jgi:hypothetical protein
LVSSAARLCWTVIGAGNAAATSKDDLRRRDILDSAVDACATAAGELEHFGLVTNIVSPGVVIASAL